MPARRAVAHRGAQAYMTNSASGGSLLIGRVAAGRAVGHATGSDRVACVETRNSPDAFTVNRGQPRLRTWSPLFFAFRRVTQSGAGALCHISTDVRAVRRVIDKKDCLHH
jgi:hypothetical protein